MQKEDINGEVKISVKTFMQLVDESQESAEVSKIYKKSISRLGDFLQFLKTKDYFKDIMEEFNGSHNKLEIYIDKDDNRAKIKPKDE